MYVRGPKQLQNPNRAGPNTRCQKCLQLGHYSYQCTNSRPYVPRPSRSKQLATAGSSALKGGVGSSKRDEPSVITPEEFKSGSSSQRVGLADKILMAKEKERERIRAEMAKKEAKAGKGKGKGKGTSKRRKGSSSSGSDSESDSASDSDSDSDSYSSSRSRSISSDDSRSARRRLPPRRRRRTSTPPSDGSVSSDIEDKGDRSRRAARPSIGRRGDSKSPSPGRDRSRSRSRSKSPVRQRRRYDDDDD